MRSLRSGRNDYLRRQMWYIEMKFVFGGWQDAGWTEDDRPLRFDDRFAAEDAIDEFIKRPTKSGIKVISADLIFGKICVLLGKIHSQN